MLGFGKEDWLEGAILTEDFPGPVYIDGDIIAMGSPISDPVARLNMEYDASTFDTDPFEPESDGVGTVFPFWVPGPEGAGYVELPCTLVQDFSLFVVLREPNIDVWKRSQVGRRRPLRSSSRSTNSSMLAARMAGT